MKHRGILLRLAMALAVCAALVAVAPTKLALALSPDPSAGASGPRLEAEESSYPIWVGNTRVTIYNARDVLGNGTVSYDASTNTLTLKNANIKKYATINSDFNIGLYWKTSKALTIKLVGNNTISAPPKNMASYGIASNSNTGSLVICGNGRLTVSGGNATYYSLGILTNKLAIKNNAVVVARAGTADRISFTQNGTPEYGSFGIMAGGKISLLGNARLAAYGKQAAYFRTPTLKYGSGYVSRLQAGSSSSSIQATKSKLASQSFIKYKYIKVYNALQGKKPAKMTISKVTPYGLSIKLSWSSLSKNCTGYQVQLSKSSAFPSGSSTWTYTANNKNVTGATLTELSKNTTYYVRVRGINKVGSATCYGPWSATRSVVIGGGAAG